MSKTTKCYLCEGTLSKNEIGLNKKMHGRNVVRFYCIKCLADYLEVSVDDLLDKIDDFKSQGCVLFE
jgi:hypothetical protein